MGYNRSMKQTIKLIENLDVIEKGFTPNYPIVGKMLTKKDVETVYKKYVGLFRQANCLRKACILRDYLRKKHNTDMYFTVVGSLSIIDGKNNASFEYYYNPPLEYHAWVYGTKDKSVYDLSLPGVIERGLEMTDDLGHILVYVRPVVLATGKTLVPNYFRYSVFEVYHGNGRDEIKLKGE